MKYIVNNLGPVKEARIDVKPMTVFVGPNNAGKTWTMYLWASITNGFNHREVIAGLAEKRISRERYEPLYEFADALLSKGTAAIDMVECAAHLLPVYLDDLCRIAPQRFCEFMGTRREGFDGLSVEIDVSDERNAILERIKDDKLDYRVGGRDEKESLLLQKEPGESTCAGLASSNARTVLPEVALQRFVISPLLVMIHNAVVRDVSYFPAERALLYGVMGSLLGRRGNSDDSADGRVPDMHVARPVTVSGSRSMTPGTRGRSAPECLRLASMLEWKVCGGRIVEQKTDNGFERVYEMPRSGKKLEMAISSSMVKELAELVSHLRYWAQKDETLCIDEPEMNLHPEAQVKLTEFLAILVNSQINVMMTTHSSYMVDHLANLLKAGVVGAPDSAKSMFFLKDKRAFITPDKVSVYLFDGGNVRSIMDEDGQIQWDTFSVVSDRLSNIHYRL